MRSEVQKVAAYLDYATIPTLAYFLDFIQQWQDKETIRLFGLARFEISDRVLADFPAGVVQFYKVVDTSEPQHFHLAFQSLLENSSKPLDITLHLNAFHSIAMLRTLWRILERYSYKLANIQLKLYDDGSEGAVNLYKLSQNADWMNEMLAKPASDVRNYVFSNYRDWDIESIFRYRLHTLLPTTYYLFDTQILTNFSPLATLESSLPNYQKMPTIVGNSLDAEQTAHLLQLLNVESEYIQRLVNLSRQMPSFLFTGTTVFWDKGYEKHELLEQLHAELLIHYTSEQSSLFAGKDLLFLFKGHPASEAMNSRLKEQFSEKFGFLPDDIPLEIFLLLGLKPTLVGGFASTSYFNLAPEQIHSAFFITDDPLGQLAYPHLYQGQSNLREVLLALGHLKQSQCYSHTQLYAT